MFNIYLAIYVVVSLAIIGGGTKKLYDLNESAGALIFCIGAVVICVIYGLRWFGSASSLLSQTPVTWPPSINSCPDYLTYYQRVVGSIGEKQDTCIDTLGVSTNGSIKVFPKDGTPPVSDEYYFKLKTNSTDLAAKNAELCQMALTAGLSWEGITNGEGCVSPSGGIVAPGTSGAAGCPPAAP